MANLPFLSHGPGQGVDFQHLMPTILFCLLWTSLCVDSNLIKELGDPARSGTFWNVLARSDKCYVFDTSLELLTLFPGRSPPLVASGIGHIQSVDSNFSVSSHVCCQLSLTWHQKRISAYVCEFIVRVVIVIKNPVCSCFTQLMRTLQETGPSQPQPRQMEQTHTGTHLESRPHVL